MSRQERSPWPIGIAVGLTLVVAANLTMVAIAVTNPSAPASADHYAEALGHDRWAGEVRAAVELGWKVSVELCADRALPDCRVQVVVRDAAGRPVSGLAGTLDLRRSDAVSFDRDTALTEAGDGVYRGRVELGDGGLYDMNIRLSGPGDVMWVTKLRTRIEGPA